MVIGAKTQWDEKNWVYGRRLCLCLKEPGQLLTLYVYCLVWPQSLSHPNIWTSVLRWSMIICISTHPFRKISVFPHTLLGRSPGEESGNPLQYSSLENPTDRGAWWATVMGSQRVELDRLTLSLSYAFTLKSWIVLLLIPFSSLPLLFEFLHIWNHMVFLFLWINVYLYY